MSKYNCSVTRGTVGFFPAFTWNTNRETVQILVLRRAQFTVLNCLWISVQNATLTTSHSLPNRTEGMVISSSATAHQVEDTECMWTWNTISCVLYFISATVHPSSIWHIVTFPYPRIECVTLSFITCLVGTIIQDRSSAKKPCIETMQDERHEMGKEGAGKRFKK